MINKIELDKVLKEHKSYKEAALVLGVSVSTLRRWRTQLGEENTTNPKNDSPKDKIQKILAKGVLEINSFSKENEIEKNEIYKILEEIEKEGKIIEKSASGYYINKNTIAQNKIYNYFGKKLKFGVIGDTHFCSKEQQLTHLNTFYDICEKEKITEVYNAGDIVAGDGVYKGQRFETFFQSLSDQVEYVIDKYPKRKNIKTHFITGNHDFSFFKLVGTDIGELIAKDRKDMVYLGKLGAYVQLNENIKMHILHPDGGGSYAESYRLQKIIEGYSSENKPGILLSGHFHTSTYLFSRNVHALTTGCFEAQTPYLVRKGLFPKVGGWIVEIIPAKDGSILRIKLEWIPFYKHIYKDY